MITNLPSVNLEQAGSIPALETRAGKMEGDNFSGKPEFLLGLWTSTDEP